MKRAEEIQVILQALCYLFGCKVRCGLMWVGSVFLVPVVQLSAAECRVIPGRLRVWREEGREEATKSTLWWQKVVSGESM